MFAKTCDHENSSATRGDSEILSIKHSPASQIPAFGKGSDDCLEVFAMVAIEEPRDVLKHQPLGPKLVDDADDFEEKASATAGESAPLAHGANVLAGEAAGDDVDAAEVACAAEADIVVLRGLWKAVPEDRPADGIDFDLPCGGKTGVFESEIEAADAGEQTTDGWFLLDIHESPLDQMLGGILVRGARPSVDLRFCSGGI